LSISELTTFRWTFDQDIQKYTELEGVSGIGVWRQKLEDFGVEAGIDRLCESGLAVSSLMWAGGFTGSDVHSYREAIDDGVNALRTAAALRAQCLIVYTGPRAGHTHNHARRLAINAIDELAGVASDLDVTLAIEPIQPCCANQWTFLNNLDEAVAILDEVQSGEVKIVYDTYHLAHQGFDEKQLAQIVPRIVLVQLGDGKNLCHGEPNRCRLGKGNIALREIVTVLGENGYDGFYEVELLGPSFEQADYDELLRETLSFGKELAGVSSRQTSRSFPRT
jgi:sugar phosphate isomerase/epimerase